MQSIKETPEKHEQFFGDSIHARDEAIKLLGIEEGIGPPDLCWVR